MRHNERIQKALTLLWYPLQASKGYSARSWITRHQYATMLDFIYHGIYEDEADNLANNFDSEEFARYSKYLEDLRQEILADTPQKILLS
jgi:hypothetical protein